MNVGRMRPEAREARRELEAEEVIIHVAMDMISEMERASLYNVQSFNNADKAYELRLENDTVKACKHMFLLRRCTEYDKTLTLFHFKSPTYTEVSTIEGLQPEPEPELQREQGDMVQKLMLKEVVENPRPDKVTSS
ncbi:hypothetical protein AB4K20DRAFT_1881845 [Rhizopus microsporus]